MRMRPSIRPMRHRSGLRCIVECVIPGGGEETALGGICSSATILLARTSKLDVVGTDAAGYQTGVATHSLTAQPSSDPRHALRDGARRCSAKISLATASSETSIENCPRALFYAVVA